MDALFENDHPIEVLINDGYPSDRWHYVNELPHHKGVKLNAVSETSDFSTNSTSILSVIPIIEYGETIV